MWRERAGSWQRLPLGDSRVSREHSPATTAVEAGRCHSAQGEQRSEVLIVVLLRCATRRMMRSGKGKAIGLRGGGITTVKRIATLFVLFVFFFAAAHAAGRHKDLTSTRQQYE